MHRSFCYFEVARDTAKYQNFKIFFDNWFFSITLCLALKDYVATATLRADRTKGYPLPGEKDLKKQGRRCEQWHLSDKMF